MGNKQSIDIYDPDDDDSVAPADAAQLQAAAKASPLGARLYKFEREKNPPWVLVGVVDPDFVNDADNEEDDAPEWYFHAGDISLKVHDSNKYLGDKPNRRATFWARDGAYAFKFNSAEGFDAFDTKYDIAKFENFYGCKRTEANIKKARGVEDMDVDYDYVDEEVPPPTPVAAPRTAEKIRFKESLASKAKPGADTSDLQIGALKNSYVLRGDAIDVYTNVDQGLQDAAQTIRITQLGTPQKAIMANGERQFVFLTPNVEKQASRVAQFDIETGKVITAWKTENNSVDLQLTDIMTRAKGTQLEDDSTFMSINQRQLMAWDMRTAGGATSSALASPTVMTYAGGTSYQSAHNYKFTCLATTGDGHVAVGNETGEIRCFTDKTLTKSKTNFPGLGGKITHLDVSFDGRWVIATTDSYIAVLCTWAKNDKGRVQTAFEAPLARKLPAPRLLKLLPSDVAMVGSAPFRTAKFTWVTENGKQERRIVASVGNFSVVWNFFKFKRATAPSTGVKDFLEYSIVATAGQVVDSGFVHDNWRGGRASANKLVQAVKNGEVHSLIDEEGAEDL